MAAGINYHIHIRTSYSKDGWLLLWKRDPQKNIQTMERVRKLTRTEIKRHVKERDKNNRDYWLDDSVVFGG